MASNLSHPHNKLTTVQKLTIHLVIAIYQKLSKTSLCMFIMGILAKALILYYLSILGRPIFILL